MRMLGDNSRQQVVVVVMFEDSVGSGVSGDCFLETGRVGDLWLVMRMWGDNSRQQVVVVIMFEDSVGRWEQ